MRVIFLDIDGVLNCTSSKSECGAYKGIDDKKVVVLKELVDKTQAKIVLASSWKESWYKEQRLKDCQDELANYLDRKLRRQRLYILDKIEEGHRAEEIQKYVATHPVEAFVILDDEDADYQKYCLDKFWIKTDDVVGLSENVADAINILSGQIG